MGLLWVAVEGTKPRKMAMEKNKIISTLVISVFVVLLGQPHCSISYLALETPKVEGKQDPTRLGAEWLAVLLGQEKSSIWLLSRIPEGVMRPLPKGRFRELGVNIGAR